MWLSGKPRAFFTIALAFGIWHTVDEWTKLTTAFLQWQLKPQIDMFQIGILNGIGNLFILIGTFPMGQIVDSVGTKFAAMTATVIAGSYFILISRATTFIGFLLGQILKIGFQFPQISEAFICSVYTEEQERTRALMRLTIPIGVALVLGPYIGGYLSDTFTDQNLLALAGVVLVLAVLPIVLFLLPEVTDRKGMSVIPKFSNYVHMFKSEELRFSLLFKFLVDVPYQAYDQLSRTYIVHHMLKNHSDMFHLFILLGVSTLLTNVLVIKFLQNYFRPQRLLQVSLAILTVSYLLLTTAKDFWTLALVMPVQIVGILIAYAELVGSVMGSVERQHVGKAAGLSQGSMVLSATVMPPVAGYLVANVGFSTVCFISAVITLVAGVLVQFYGGFMNRESSEIRLPHNINPTKL